MSGIKIGGLEKRFGNTIAINDLDLVIKEGEFVSLLGPSGCGKTTVLRSLAGLETPNAGTIEMNDQVVFSATKAILVPPGRRGLGMVFQSYALWPHMTVEANVTFGLEVIGLKREEQKDKMTKALQMVGIEELAKRYPSELSGGQQQRVALARAIVTEPRVLLLDEPLSNLDAKLRLQMRAELQRLHRQLGCTIVYVTHDQIEAMTLSTSVVVLRQGVLQQIASPHQIYRQPANSWVADFVGNPSINMLNGIVLASGDEIRLDCGPTLRVSTARLTPGAKVSVGLRPEDLQPNNNGQAIFNGAIHSVQPAGSETFAQVRVNTEIVTIKVPGELNLAIDEEVKLGVEAKAVLVFDFDSGKLLKS